MFDVQLLEDKMPNLESVLSLFKESFFHLVNYDLDLFKTYEKTFKRNFIVGTPFILQNSCEIIGLSLLVPTFHLDDKERYIKNKYLNLRFLPEDEIENLRNNIMELFNTELEINTFDDNPFREEKSEIYYEDYHISAIFVRNGYRRQGIGGRLLGASIEHVNTINRTSTIYSSCLPTSKELFKSFEFQPISYLNPVHYNGDSITFMGLDLSS